MRMGLRDEDGFISSEKTFCWYSHAHWEISSARTAHFRLKYSAHFPTAERLIV